MRPTRASSAGPSRRVEGGPSTWTAAAARPPPAQPGPPSARADATASLYIAGNKSTMPEARQARSHAGSSTIPNMGMPNGIPNMGVPNGGATPAAILAGFAAAAAAGRQGGARDTASIGAPEAPPRASAPPATAPSVVAPVPTTAPGAGPGAPRAASAPPATAPGPSAQQPGAAAPTSRRTLRATLSRDGDDAGGGGGGGGGDDDDGGDDDANGTVPGTAPRTYVPECSAAAIEYEVSGGGGGGGGGGGIGGGGGSIGGVGGVGSCGMATACGGSAVRSSVTPSAGTVTGAVSGAASGPSQPRSPTIAAGARAHDGARLSAPSDRNDHRKDDVIVIHVCDDNRRINRDFYCSRELLLQVMSSDGT